MSRLRLAFCALSALVSAHTGAAAIDAPPASTAAPAPRHEVPRQKIAAEDVLIEGKLYSPQALFIVSRRPETFGRDAIVPQYLQSETSSEFMPYRLQPVVLEEAMARESKSTGRKP